MFKSFVFVLIFLASQGEATEKCASLVTECILRPYTVSWDECPENPVCGENLVLAKHVEDGKEVCCCKNKGDVIPCGPPAQCESVYTAWRPEPYCECQGYNDAIPACPSGLKFDFWISECIADCDICIGEATEKCVQGTLVTECILRPYTVSWDECPEYPVCGENLVLAKHVEDGKEVCCCKNEGDVVPCGPATQCEGMMYQAWRPEPYCECQTYNDGIEVCPDGLKFDFWISKCIADCDICI
ncbi:CLUMA_CG004168, isoform A [Clunio marinus]|uniref:CLUMA_CG004168, isoform A n=1 Tax=Clunio marinus TaxID=568069 RepID=A0A1J1HVH5_9DIPT|nr:CLUMA_CG004168, isoform A [Clunio marinus]